VNDVNTLLGEKITGLESQILSFQSRADILYGDITVEQAMELNETIELLVILDVRTVSEFNSVHIEGAINIPLDELQERLDELGKDDEILVYCRSGIRSSRAMKTLSNNGFSKVYNMLGGIDAWRQAFYPTIGCGCG
jgi:rhodanese-related sulfurtransferase